MDERRSKARNHNGYVWSKLSADEDVVMKFWSRRWSQEEVVKTKKVSYGMFVSFLCCYLMTFVTKLVQGLCHNSNFLIWPIAMKLLINEADRNSGSKTS